jgi:dynein heavy chain
VRQLSIFLDEYPDKTPFEALMYLTGECNYGGRVTDAFDRRTLLTILADYYTEKIFDDSYTFSPSGLYFSPKHGEYESYMEFARGFPQFPEPEIFGFHSNAAITKDLNDTANTLEAILLTQQQAGGGADADQDEKVRRIADNILSEVPKPFDVKSAEQKYPVKYEQSMNTVLTQELIRFNVLIRTIRSSLENLKKAIKGEVLLSSDLEAALGQLIDGKVP